MDAALSTVLGGVLAAGAGALVAWFNARAATRLAGEQRAHERGERRYEALRVACARFFTVMHRLVEQAELDTISNQGAYADRPGHEDPVMAVRAAEEAEGALAELRLLADDALYEAGRAWIDAYYARFWRLGGDEHSGDTDKACARVVAEGKKALGIPT